MYQYFLLLISWGLDKVLKMVLLLQFRATGESFRNIHSTDLLREYLLPVLSKDKHRRFLISVSKII